MEKIYITLDSEWNGTDRDGQAVSLPAATPILITPLFASKFALRDILADESLTFEFNDFSGNTFRADDVNNHGKLAGIFDKLMEFNQ